jgi:hypothetical protein
MAAEYYGWIIYQGKIRGLCSGIAEPLAIGWVYLIIMLGKYRQL